MAIARGWRMREGQRAAWLRWLRWLRWAIYGVAACAAAGAWLHVAGLGAGAGYDFASYLQAARAVASGANPYHRLAVEYATAGGRPLSANGWRTPPRRARCDARYAD